MPEIIVKGDGGRSQSEVDIARIVDGYRQRSERARRSRIALNKENWDLYHGRQDWSHKQKHQSKEFLPDLPMAVEQIAGVIEKALSDQSDWFDVEPLPGFADDAIQKALLDAVTLRKLLAYCLSRLYTRGNYPETGHNFALLMADAIKMGLAEAVIVLKVYGILDTQTQYGLEMVPVQREGQTQDGETILYTVETERVRRIPVQRFRLAIDLIPWEDFFPDPSGLNLYDIHEVTRPIHELYTNPSYDPAVIEEIENQARQDAEAAKAKRDRGGEDDFSDESTPTVRVRECWGDLIDPDTGELLAPNVLVTTAGTRLLRPPQENPLWHGRRPFVKAPLIRVPLSTVHKAILDHAGPMARLMNELTNLMIDGGFAATWGTRQVRPDLMETPEEISDGIPQGYTAVLKPGVPENTKFLERVDEGQVPEFAAVMLARIERSFQVSMATPDLKLGVLPPRQVKATEVVEAMQASSGLFESLIAHGENGLVTPTLELGWLTIWQYLDNFTEPELVQILGPDRAAILQSLSPAARFVRLAQSVRFRVTGLRATVGRMQEYQKLMALLQTLGINPAFAAAFDAKYSVQKFFAAVVKSLGIDPTTLEKPPGAPPELNPALLGGPGGGSAGGTGGPESEIEAGYAAANPGGQRGSQFP